MKKVFYLIIGLLLISTSFSQIIDPVKWSTKTEKISETEFTLVATGKIEDQWHVYSQFTPDGGSLPMELSFKDQKGNFELIGKAVESPYKKAFNDVFGVEEYYFEKTVTVTQKIKIANPKTAQIKLVLDYQVCKESCINDRKNLVFDLPVIKTVENVEPVVPAVDTTKDVKKKN